MAFKLNNETKVGILTAVTITVFILGFSFMRGKGVFSSAKTYYTYYDNVQGLQESAAILLQGYAVGKVANIELQPDRKIKVTLSLKENIVLPEGSAAKLASGDLVSGSKVINLVIPEMANNASPIKDGSQLPGLPSDGLLDNLSEQVSPLVSVIQHTVVSLDSLLSSVNTILNQDARIHLNRSLESLDIGLKELAMLSSELNKQSQGLAGVIQNANSITGNLANSNASITSTLNNLEIFSEELGQAPIQKTFDNLEKTISNLNGIVAQINNNEGSVGLLLSDPKMYHNLTGTLGSLDSLLSDLKKHPSKYINVSVFGRRVKD